MISLDISAAAIIFTSEGSKSSTHYLGDKNRFDVSSKGPLSGISVGGRGKHACFYTSEYIKTTRDKIKTNQMDLIKTRNIKMQIILYFIYRVKNRRYVRKHARS